MLNVNVGDPPNSEADRRRSLIRTECRRESRVGGMAICNARLETTEFVRMLPQFPKIPALICGSIRPESAAYPYEQAYERA